MLFKIKSWFHDFKVILKSRDIEIMEVLVCLGLIHWGIFHIWPFSGAVGVFGPIHDAMKVFASESAWGLVSTSLGATYLNAVVKNDINHRLRCSLISFMMWSGCAAITFKSAIILEPAVLYIIFAASSLFIYIRLSFWTR